MRSSKSSTSVAHPAVVARARAFRASTNGPERVLCALLRGKQLGVWFRRQVPLGRFVADFAAPAAGLVVEVDGRHHVAQRARDAQRDRALARMGYRVLRLEAALVLQQPLVALARVREALGR